jgi:hypothetical protein
MKEQQLVMRVNTFQEVLYPEISAADVFYLCDAFLPLLLLFIGESGLFLIFKEKKRFDTGK